MNWGESKWLKYSSKSFRKDFIPSHPLSIQVLSNQSKERISISINANRLKINSTLFEISNPDEFEIHIFNKTEQSF